MPRPRPLAHRKSRRASLRSAFVTTLTIGAAGCSSYALPENPPQVMTTCTGREAPIGAPCRGGFTCNVVDCTATEHLTNYGCVDGTVRALGPATCSSPPDAGSHADAGDADAGHDDAGDADGGADETGDVDASTDGG